VNHPSERITLALRPKAPPEASAKSAAPVERPHLPPALDPRVYDELKLATTTYDHLSRFGDPVEFWEAVRLARSNRGVTESADGSSGDNGLAEELQAIRRQLSPMVRDLRRYLTKVTDVPKAGEALEISLGFLLASSREHQAVAKWLAESDKHLGKAASKLRSLYEIAAPYLEVLRPWSLDGPRAPLGGQPGEPPVEDLSKVPLQPDVQENFRRSFVTRQLFVETDLQAAFWEIHMLNTAERIPCQTRLEQIKQARNGRQLAVFHEEARSLHSRLLPLRARHGRWVEALHAFLRPLPGMPHDASLFEMALAFVVVESGSMDRARRWLGEPEASAKEAVAHVQAIALQVKAYIAAMKK
jgi:hypothetical protein